MLVISLSLAKLLKEMSFEFVIWCIIQVSVITMFNALIQTIVDTVL